MQLVSPKGGTDALEHAVSSPDPGPWTSAPTGLSVSGRGVPTLWPVTCQSPFSFPLTTPIHSTVRKVKVKGLVCNKHSVKSSHDFYQDFQLLEQLFALK